MRSSCSTWPDPLSRAAFHRLCLRLARERGADLFLSGAGHVGADRSLCALDPVDELEVLPETSPERIKRFCFDTPGPALGWLGYAFGMRLRSVPATKPESGPQGLLRKYAVLLEHDAATGRVRVFGNPNLPSGWDEPLPQAWPPFRVGPVRANLSRAGYEDRVRETLERIRGGHTYQLNLSMRFEADSPDLDPAAWFAHLLEHHPAPFYCWFRSGPNLLLSTSPERFLRVRGGEVLTQPIKGTWRIPPGRDREPVETLARELLASPKEDAELSMIVDLLRNDISACCEHGSVRVERHKSVFRVDNLLQMQSDVRGRLRPGADCLDLLFSAFPGGSVTGCPKRRSMRIIEELEPHARGAYCGSFVIIEDRQNMDSSIAIRTARYDTRSGRLVFHAGSGIVVDSDPAAEYLETMAKAEKFFGGPHGPLP